MKIQFCVEYYTVFWVIGVKCSEVPSSLWSIRDHRRHESSAAPLSECQKCYKMLVHYAHSKLSVSSEQHAVRVFWLYKLQDEKLCTEAQDLL
jgi:hypothetical protein